MSTPFAERMVHIRDVGWSRNPTGRGYWVQWTEDGIREVRTFRTAGAAALFAAWLDTSGQQETPAERARVERALEELAETVRDVERGELEELGVPITTARQRRRTERQLAELQRAFPAPRRHPSIPVQRYVRKRRSGQRTHKV